MTLADQPLDLVAARAWFARELELRTVDPNRAVVAAFATVDRARFLGPPPWRVMPGGIGPWTETSTAADLCHDIIVSIDPAKQLNNGAPSLWMMVLSRARLQPGEHLVHIGAGTGYYSAIIAECVGEHGSVEAIEIEPDLATRAETALAPWPWARVRRGDGRQLSPASVDAIVLSAGVTEPLPAWLDALTDGGRLVLPITQDDWHGRFVLIERRADRFDARVIGPVSIYHCVVGRRVAIDRRALQQALRRPPEGPMRLHRGQPSEGATTWLVGADCWFEPLVYMQP